MTPSENPPLPDGPTSYRVGDADRAAAVARLQSEHAAGRLDEGTYTTLVASAEQAKTQSDLDAVLNRVPPVVTSGSFELYPHKSVAPAWQPPANPVAPDDPDPVPAGQRASTGKTSFKLGSLEVNNIPSWVIPVIVGTLVMGIILALSNGRFPFPWWLIFFVPGIFGWSQQNEKKKRRRDRDRLSEDRDQRSEGS